MDSNSGSKSSKISEICESKERPWSGLLLGILLSVASRLALPDRVRMAAACRRWRSIPYQTFSLLGPPCLMTFGPCEDRRLVELIDPFSDKAYNLLLPELDYSSVLSSGHGWLLLCRDDLFFFFLNPITKQRKDLPPLNFLCRSPNRFKAAFSSAPTSPDCEVVVISVQYNYFQIWHPGCEQWTPPCPFDSILTPLSAHDPFFCHGLLWCMGFRRAMDREVRVFLINPAEKKWMVHVISIPINGIGDWGTLYMTGFEGEAFMISVGRFREPVRVFKLAQSLKTAEEIQSLRGRTIYLGSNMARMAISGVRWMENKIYFPKIQRTAGWIEYYSMETCECYVTLGLTMSADIKHGVDYVEQIWIQ